MKIKDFTTAEFYADPYPLYSQLREAGPIVSLGHKTWITGRYSVIDAILRDKRLGRSYMQGISARYGSMRANEPIFRAYENMLLMMDSPGHTRLRSLLAKAFNAKQESRFKELTLSISNKLIDRIKSLDTFDVMRDYATPLPLAVICDMLDVPFENSSIFSKAISAIVQNLEVARMRDEQINAANLAIEELENYFSPILSERKRNPGDDLISRMILAEVDGERFNESEILSNIILLFFAGHETTSNMIGNALIALHKNPEQLEKLLSDISLVPNVVAECLRYDGSAQLANRTALENLEVEGVKIERGDMLFCFLGSANRDPEKFFDADNLIIDRNDQLSRHMTFGGGIHNCLGARLAVIEIEIALDALFRNLPNLKITNLDNLRWHQRNALRGVESLSVSVDMQ